MSFKTGTDQGSGPKTLPQSASIEEKLYGGLPDLETTEQFISYIGQVIWTLQHNNENEEETDFWSTVNDIG